MNDIQNDSKGQAEEKEVEVETTQVPSPDTKDSTTGDQTTAKESGDQGSVAEDESDLPVDEMERRRAFQEQRQEIKRLREEVAARGPRESAFNAFRAQTPPVGQTVAPRIENYTNPVTGETDYAAYNQAVNQVITQQASQNAAYIAQQTTKELLDENNARQKHPELFADQETEQEIADRWLAAKMRGENPSISEIADRVAKRFKRAISSAEKVGAEKILTEVSEKEKAGLSASSQTAQPARQQASQEDLERLQTQTRRGDDDAIAARISRIPWANK